MHLCNEFWHNKSVEMTFQTSTFKKFQLYNSSIFRKKCYPPISSRSKQSDQTLWLLGWSEAELFPFFHFVTRQFKKVSWKAFFPRLLNSLTKLHKLLSKSGLSNFRSLPKHKAQRISSIVLAIRNKTPVHKFCINKADMAQYKISLRCSYVLC